MPPPRKAHPHKPSPPRPTDARAVAWLALRDADDPQAGRAQERLGELAAKAGLSPRDRGLAFELMQGVLRERRPLDTALHLLKGFGEAVIDPPLQNLLRLGAYQYFRLTRIPVHALVHATVQVAREQIGDRAAGFCNAALNQMNRQFPNRPDDYEKLRAELPLEARESFPGWIARLVRRTFGPDNLEPALTSLNRALPIYARANTLIASPDEVVAVLAAADIVAKPRPDLAPQCIEIEATAGLIAESEIFKRGCLILQDASSQLVAEFVGARPGMTVIDFCAAPGGKSTALAAAMKTTGHLWACDISQPRMKRLGENIERLGLSEFAQVRLLDESQSAIDTLLAEILAAGEPNGVDRVLVDAPCSGLGTLRRHPEIRWRLRNADIARLATLQGQILDRAATLVAPGGILVYATCSFAPEENDAVVAAFLERHPDAFEILTDTQDLPPAVASRIGTDGYLRTLPHRDEADSATAVRLMRR